MTELTLGDAAKRIGVSVDTLRRWAAAGKLRTSRDARNRRLVPEAEVERLAPHPDRHRAGDTLSARNRFPGVVTSVEVDESGERQRVRGTLPPTPQTSPPA